jgi:CDGSH-type Zn-finger protein
VETSITPYRNGPYLLRGAFSLRDQDGVEIANARRVVALCRCGKSRTRPFCDGTHRLIDFTAPSGLERASGSAWQEQSPHGG